MQFESFVDNVDAKKKGKHRIVKITDILQQK